MGGLKFNGIMYIAGSNKTKQRIKMLRRFYYLTVLLGVLGLAILPANATSIFTETFNYPVGANLDGQNGGSGFSGAWTGGNSTIVGVS